jgi:thiol-disulfide isomerase/thioredoxin
MNKYLSIFLLGSLLPGCACKKEKSEKVEAKVKQKEKQVAPSKSAEIVEPSKTGEIKEIHNEDELKKYKKAVVKFHAKWCGACKVSTPAFQELAIKYPDIAFLSIDIDEEGDLKDKHQTQGVPTFIVFENGKKKATILGFNKKKLEEELKELAGDKKKDL